MCLYTCICVYMHHLHLHVFVSLICIYNSLWCIHMCFNCIVFVFSIMCLIGYIFDMCACCGYCRVCFVWRSQMDRACQNWQIRVCVFSAHVLLEFVWSWSNFIKLNSEDLILWHLSVQKNRVLNLASAYFIRIWNMYRCK